MISIRLQKVFLAFFWIAAGVSLYSSGAKKFSLFYFDQKLTLALFIGAFFLGEMKWRILMKKSVERDPVPRDFFFIALMGGLGILMTQLDTPTALRSFIRVAVGWALLRGGMVRIRALLTKAEETPRV